MSYDVSLGPGTNPEKPLAHRPDCAYVRMQADLGEPVITMLGCEKPLPDSVELHSCLKEESWQHPDEEGTWSSHSKDSRSA